jgi:predicted aspartyl protease
MKNARTIRRRGLALVAALMTLTTGVLPAQDEEFRTFTNLKGGKIEAMILGKTDTSVTLQVKGRENSATVPLESLSKEDQEFIQGWDQTKAVFLRQCRTLTVRELLELRGYESFKFEFANNSIIVPGLLNGKPARFLIDTGAHSTVLDDAFAKAAGCKVGPMTEVISGVAGTAPAGWCDVPKIQLGETLLKDRKILATDLSNGLPEGAKPKEDAIFGAEFLSQLDAVISYRERLIFLRPDLGDSSEVEDVDVLAEDKDEKLAFRLFKLKDGTTLRGKIIKKTATGVTLELVDKKERSFTADRFKPEDALVIRRWSKDAVNFEESCRDLTVQDLLNLRGYQSFDTKRVGNHIYVDGSLNGNDVRYMVDTGADGSLFNLSDAEDNKCEVGPMDQWVYGIGGRAPAAVTQFATLSVGDTLFENRRLLSAKLGKGESIGIYGGDFMRELDAVITYREMRLFLRQE